MFRIADGNRLDPIPLPDEGCPGVSPEETLEKGALAPAAGGVAVGGKAYRADGK